MYYFIMKWLRRANRGFLIFGLVALALASCCPDLALAAPNKLKDIALGTTSDYNRLVFTFENQLQDVILRRNDVNTLYLDFGPAQPGKFVEGPHDNLINTIQLAQDGERLIGVVTLNSNRFEVRHFLSRDRFSCVVDLKSLNPVEETPATVDDQLMDLDNTLLEPPKLKDVVKAFSLFIQPNKNPSSPENLLQSAFDSLLADDYDAAIAKFDNFKKTYPKHPLSDPALFVLGDAYMAKGLEENFIQATTAWQEAIENYPNSIWAPRAAFMIAEAYRLNGYRNEAEGYFKLCAENYPDSPLSPLAILRAADLELAMGLNDKARETVAPLAAKSLTSKFPLLARGRLAMADYQDTLYSPA
ncbi:MAG: tetratricopeptide repeat protein, partial [Deltaproteobacteria bacterium]|nr:tetratricopeptide repeat protein [Deltaproteobacteria bacterium]